MCFLSRCWRWLPCYCMYVNTASQLASKQPHRRNSLQTKKQKKRDSPWISASEQKWLPCITRMGPFMLESFLKTDVQSFMIEVSLLFLTGVFFLLHHRLCCVTSVNLFFNPINDYIIFSYQSIHVLKVSWRYPQDPCFNTSRAEQSLYLRGNKFKRKHAGIKPQIPRHVTAVFGLDYWSKKLLFQRFWDWLIQP